MKGLLAIENVRVPLSQANKAHEFLRQVGLRDSAEAVALWAGTIEGTIFHVNQTIIPEQTPHRTPTGLCYTVSSEELHRTNVWLYEHGVRIIAQLHSHPSDAFHSELDDALPLATTAGCFSLVIPDFARHPFSLERCATYRLMPGRGWEELAPSEAARLITIVDDSALDTKEPKKKPWPWHLFSTRQR